MKKRLNSALEDLSTDEVLRFQLCCEVCGKQYASKPIRFSKAGVDPKTPEKRILYRAVYEQEHKSARNNAIERATENFNFCPICKRMVCNQCFLICEDLDMCQSCADKLKETGKPVDAEAAAACS